MRKQVEQFSADLGSQTLESAFLDLDVLARVEISSEAADHSIEGALLPSYHARGWRAAEPGAQTLRLRFDRPQAIGSIYLVFEAEESARTQEFVLRWSCDCGVTYRDLVRQQFNFSPPGTTREEEHYELNLRGVDVLQLTITPDISGRLAFAALKELRLT